MPLTDKQNETIDLLIVGNLSKVQIAKAVGIAEKSIYNWLNNNVEFKAELQRRTDVFNDTRIIDAKNKLSIHLDMAINNIVEMAQDKDNPKRFECNKYIVDRNLGNTTTKVETKNADNDKNEDVNIDELVNEVVDNKE
ncbi:phBC6A51 family helix-turn-helix protein [uncultured Clostridium sp.]|uniref:phBC6A51 family helix-turn-helix protein n=1 Tax=uncultured Clostridium sp. TaxID=59620 RepID=UPI0028E3D3C3|nr:phBC6A51 family helix-turn-helix protein [uncultured Clostridium sp.]